MNITRTAYPMENFHTAHSIPFLLQFLHFFPRCITNRFRIFQTHNIVEYIRHKEANFPFGKRLFTVHFCNCVKSIWGRIDYDATGIQVNSMQDSRRGVTSIKISSLIISDTESLVRRFTSDGSKLAVSRRFSPLSRLTRLNTDSTPL